MNLSQLKDTIREIIRELEEEELEEISTTGGVAGYNTPNAFKKTDGRDKDDEPDSQHTKKLNQSTGYVKVNEAIKRGKRYGDWSITQYEPVKYDDLGSANGGKIKLVNQETADTLLIQNDLALRGNKWWISHKNRKIEDKNPEVVIQKVLKLQESVLSENRYHQLRKSEGTPNQKIGVGIRELRKQLTEIEKFVNWYSNIKTENDMGYTDYWKRTQKHLNKISERLSKLSLKVRELSS